MSFVKITEQSSLYDDLEKKSIREILTEINQEDQKVALAVQRVIPQIEELVAGIVKRMRRGRLFYIGAVPADGWGTGRLEIPPTLHTNTYVIGFIAVGIMPAQPGGGRERPRDGLENQAHGIIKTMCWSVSPPGTTPT